MAMVAANLKLAPADAVEYFRSKGLQLTWDWQDMRREAHNEAFTVAKVTSLDVLRTIQQMVDKAISTGITFDEFKRTLRPQLEAAGWWGKAEVLDGNTGEVSQAQLGSTRRLRTIYQTNVQTAYMAGRFQRYLDGVALRPYWRYVAILDGRTRPTHRALHGKVWRYDDPIWQVIWPPNGWGCRCRVQALTEAEFRALGVPLEDGRHAIDTVEVPINKAGDMMDVQVVRYTDERGRERTFMPDPGWDYNPGAAYAAQKAAARVLADKVGKVPPALGSDVATQISASPPAQVLLDQAWRSFVGDVLADPVPRKRMGVVGFLRPQDVAALADRGVEVGNVVITADDSRIVGAKGSRHEAAGDALSAADWSNLHEQLREPQAVLLDKANGTLLYVLATADGRGQRIVVAPAFRSRASAVVASLRTAYWSRLEDLRGNLEGGALELLEGTL